MSEGGGISQAVWNRACSGGTWTFGEICVGASDLFKTADKAEKGSGKGKAHDDGAGKNGVSSGCFAHTGRDF